MNITSQAPVVNPPLGWPRIAPHLIYEDPAGAITWLTRAFGFTECTSARHSSAEGTVERAQMQVGDSLLTLGLPSIHGDSPKKGVSSMLKIYVDDVDAHYQRARAAGATMVLDLVNEPWGDRRYQAADPEGHQWCFAQHIFDAAPDAWTKQPLHS